MCPLHSVSKISIEKKSDIIISQVMYTELLESIFENDLNLNVIVIIVKLIN